VVVDYLLLVPARQFSGHSTSDIVASAIFCFSGVLISIVTALYRHSREKLAAYQMEAAVLDERRKVEEARRVAESIHAEHQRFLDVLETLPTMISLLTPDHHIAFANRSFRERFSECQGRHCFEVRFGRKAPCDICETFKVLETGQPHRWEVTFPDGSLTDFYDFPLTDLDGSPLILEMGIDITERRRTENERRKYRENLEALAERLQHVREEERTKVARDLHDQIGQILTAIKMDMAWVVRHLLPSDDEVHERLSRSIELINDGVISVRKICSGLRPGILDDLGLAAAIEWQAKEFASRTGIACQVFVPSGHSHLDGDQITAIFRIFQECLTNITRHAEAQSVRTVLSEQDGFLVLVVKDDGKGFRESEVANSLGILGMKERAQACGGNLQVSSSPGKGTTVSVRVPVRAASMEREDNAYSDSR
jgi:signal transduction histidine kinase